MPGGSTNTTTQTNVSEAPSWVQDELKTNLNLASNIGPESFSPFPGSTVVPNATQTDQSLNYMQNFATSNMNGQGLSGQYQNTINQGGFANPMQMNAAGQMQALSDGSTNPYFEDALQSATDRTMDAVNLGASSAGRYGSGAHTGTLAREIGDLQTTARANQFNQDLNRQMQASGNLFNMGQQAFQNVGSAYQGAMAPANTLGQVGASYEDLLGRTINDQIRIFEGEQRAPITATEWRNAIASGAGATAGGTTTSTAQMPGQNPWATAAGVGLTGLGALGSFGIL